MIQHNNKPYWLYILLALSTITILLGNYLFELKFYKKNKNLQAAVIQEIAYSNKHVIYFGDSSALVTNPLFNFACIVDLEDGFVSQVIKSGGNYYQPEIAMTLKKVLKKGDTVIHLGGHIGSFEGLMANLVGDEGKIFTFEPSPRSYSFLQRNVNLHNANHIVTTYNLGAWSENTTKSFAVSKLNSGGSKVIQNEEKESIDTITIDLVNVDDLLQDKVSSIDLLFMDIEGSEYHALDGMKKILKNSPDVIILMEYSDTIHDKDVAFKFFQQQFDNQTRIFLLQYVLDTVYYHEVTSLEQIQSIKYGDLVLMPKSRNSEDLLRNIRAYQIQDAAI